MSKRLPDKPRKRQRVRKSDRRRSDLVKNDAGQIPVVQPVGEEPKTKYRRSTPVIRLGRNVERVIYLIGIVLARLRSWQSVGNMRLEHGAGLAVEIAERSARLGEMVSELEKSGFVPPRKWTAYQPEPGHHVRVIDQFRQRYELLYEKQLLDDPQMLDDLVVVKVLSSGEVALQRGRRTPLVARKTHLCPVRKTG
jgi:hypothetical protein